MEQLKTATWQSVGVVTVSPSSNEINPVDCNSSRMVLMEARRKCTDCEESYKQAFYFVTVNAAYRKYPQIVCLFSNASISGIPDPTPPLLKTCVLVKSVM
jgi:hypothetical protein